MAVSLCNGRPRVFTSLHHKHTPRIHQNNLRFSKYNKLRFFLSIISPNSKPFCHFSRLKSSSINGVSVQSNNLEHIKGEVNVEVNEKISRWIHFIQSIFPGGSWWSFDDDFDVKIMAKPVTVWRALTKMWELVAKDRWVMFAAFSALIVSALSEIFVPHFLTASIFTAQSGQIAVFHRNVRLLIMLCVTSGICSGLRGCCFGIANMILVKRMRETLYSALLLQDISFFDSETVGDLTSRLGSDCQQVSRVIGYDLNLILRNVLQGTGSLIYLLILSWPLGLCTLMICTSLAGVLLIYGL